MIRMDVDEVAAAVSGTIVTGREPVDISGWQLEQVSSDSRQRVSDGLFVAIRGERVDGHDFLGSAAAHGYRAALVDHPIPNAPLLQIQVDDTVAALAALAQRNLQARRQLSSPFTLIGITGSVGKTTTKDLTSALLSVKGPTVAPVGSFNNEIGLPLTALKVDERTRFFVAEMGANHIGEIRDLTRVAPPDISVVLKVGTAHLGEFGSVENIFIAKSEIVEALGPTGLAILNADDANVARMAGRTAAKVRWFGLGGSNGSDRTGDSGDSDGSAQVAGADRPIMVSAADVTVDQADRPSFSLFLSGQPAGRIQLQLAGQHNVMNALAAISVAVELGLRPEEIAKVLGRPLALSPHRMAVSRVELGPSGPAFTLIDDSFNANPDSMRSGLDGLAQTHQSGAAFRVAVLGPMLELGHDSERLHEQIGAYAVEQGVNALIAVGVPDPASGADLPALAAALATGARRASRTQVEQATAAAPVLVEQADSLEQATSLVAAWASSQPDTVVLLKGSHASGVGALADRWAQGEPGLIPAGERSTERRAGQ